MGNQLVAGFVTVATALIGVAIIATLVSQRANTSQVIRAATGGFAQDIGAAVSPIVGTNSFTGGGAGWIQPG